MNPQTQTVILHSDRHYGRRVPALALGGILEILPDAVRQSVRMAFEGRSRARGTRPEWLRAAADIRFISHEGDDETVLHFEAPTLGEAAARIYEQKELWATRPAPEDTGFDLLADVIADIANRNADSERFDRPLLDRIAGFRKTLNGTFSDMVIAGNRRAGERPGVVTPGIADVARNLYTSTPAPRRVRVVGRLDMLRVSTQTFGVLLDDGQEVRGVLTEGDMARLAPLLMKRVMILGMAVYRPSGRLLRIDAEEVAETTAAGDFFSQIPQPKPEQFNLRDVLRAQQHKPGIAAIIGTWPGDETDEQVEQALEELS